MESINWENVNLQGRFLKRFQKEIQNIINKPPEGIKFIKTLKKEEIDKRLKEDRNEGEKEPNFVFFFEVSIKPDKDSIYEDGIFHVIVKIPEDYPFSPPECFMKTPIYHPNIYEGNGHICLNNLSKNWNSTMTLERLFISIMMLLDLPNTDDFLDYDKAQHFIKDHDDFVKTAKQWVEKYAKE